MRSNALPYSKTSTEEKTPHPSAFGCHLLPPEKAYLNLLFPPVGVGAPDDPHALFPTNLPSTIQTSALLCLLLREKGDRVAVDEE